MYFNVDYEQRTNWENLRKFRNERIVGQLKKKGLRAVVLSKLDTIRYATSFKSVQTWMFHGNRHVVIVTDEGHVSLLVASGDFKRVKSTMPWLTDVEPFPFLMTEGYPIVEKKLKELGVTKGKVGIDMMTYGIIKKMQQGFPEIDFVDGSSVVEDAQLVKCQEEIDCLRVTAQAVDIGMTDMLDNIREGNTEMQISSIAAQRYMSLGADEVPYFPLVVSGPNSWLGYRYPTERRLQRGDMVWMDAGCCIINGYNGDIARTCVVGPATKEQKNLYVGIYDMLHYAIQELRPGNSVSKPLDAAAAAADKHGLLDKTYFGILGHGIGTDLHIAPTIGDKAVDNIDREVSTFNENMVIALEPGIFLDGVGGGCMENMVLITKDGPEVLTKTRFEDHLLV
ncbi:MAG: M24 family metallopeptidase [Clostridia bacterium]